MTEVQLARAADLVPYAKNARTHSRQQLDMIKASIRQFGFTNPLIIDAAGILAGHGRQVVALEMWASGETIMGPGKRVALPEGMLPIINADGLSEAERRAYVLADNQIATQSDWDKGILSGELLALKAMDFQMATIGFQPSDLARFMARPGAKNQDEIPPPTNDAGFGSW